MISVRLSSMLQRKRLARVQGQAAEDRALAHLQAQGLQLVARNFRVKGGELDLIMRDTRNTRDVLVFVEVRQRSSAEFGGALESITPTKQARLTRAAQCFLQTLPVMPACRFDVVAIDRDVLRWLVDVQIG